MRSVVFTLAAAVAVLLPVGPASAYLTTTGTGAASGLAASVPRATGVGATQVDEGTVRVSWTRPASSFPVAQRVERISDAGTTTVCTTSTASCDDAAVRAGTYTYRVISTYRTWSSRSDASPAVTVVDHTPTITAFTRRDPASTNLSTVAWNLTFSEPVTGLQPSNFATIASGIIGASIGSVIGSGSSWIVSATTGTGSGSLALSLVSSSGVTDSAGNAVVVPATSEQYAIRPSFPTSLSIANGGSNNRIDAGDTITITFSTAIDPSVLCAAWTTPGDHTATSATVTLHDGGTANDSLTFELHSCPVLHLGGLALGSPAFATGGSVTFAATVSSSVSTHSVVIVLGARAGTGTVAVVGGGPISTYLPDPLLVAADGVAVHGSVSSTGRF